MKATLLDDKIERDAAEKQLNFDKKTVIKINFNLFYQIFLNFIDKMLKICQFRVISNKICQENHFLNRYLL